MASPDLAIRTLLQAVLTRIDALAAGLTFQTITGAPAALATHLYRLPNTALDASGAGPFPYLVARPLGGSEGEKVGVTRVLLLAGVYNEGASNAGEDDLEALIKVILRLSEDQNFSPYALLPDITFQNGGEKDGGQDPPEFYMTATLSFGREPFYLNF